MNRLLARFGPSLTSRLVVTGGRRLVRPQMDRLRLEGIQLHYLRGAVATAGMLASWPRTTRIEPVRDRSFAGEWVRARNSLRVTEGVVLYFHGGGYVASSARAYRCVTEPLSTLTALPVLAVSYRRAPEHPHPAALQDARRAYESVLADGIQPDQVVLAGDSAGGHLAVSLLTSLAREQRVMPAGLVLFSPLLDPALTEAVRCDALTPDPILTPTFAARCAEAFHPEGDYRDPILSPLTLEDGLLRRFPPVQTHVGSTECFAGDSERLHQRLTAVGVPNRRIVSRGQVHSYVTMSRMLPEARRALRRAADFTRSTIAAAETLSDTDRIAQ